MLLTIETLRGHKIPISIEEYETVRRVKEKVEQSLGDDYNADYIKLFWSARQLKDEYTIAESNIGQDKSIIAVIFQAHAKEDEYHPEVETCRGYEELFDEENPNTFIVEEALDDDNSLINISLLKMNNLQVPEGGLVLIKGKKHQTVSIALPRDAVPKNKICMNITTRMNLGVELGDRVHIEPCTNINSGKTIHVLPIDDTVEGVTEDLYDLYLRSYFMDKKRPVMVNNHFTVKGGLRCVEFKVVSTNPSPFCVVEESTKINYDGEPIKRQDVEFPPNDPQPADSPPAANEEEILSASQFDEVMDFLKEKSGFPTEKLNYLVKNSNQRPSYLQEGGSRELETHSQKRSAEADLFRKKKKLSVKFLEKDYEQLVSMIIEIGYSRQDVQDALKATCNNPDRAAEYLISGVLPPQNEPQAADSPPISVPPGNEAEPLAFLRSQPQFQQIRQIILQNPQFLNNVLQLIGKNKPWLKFLSENQEELVKMLNDPNPGSGQSGTPASGRSAASGGTSPATPACNIPNAPLESTLSEATSEISPQDREAIEQSDYKSEFP